MENPTQVRKKLYNAGKNWVVGGVITAGAALAFVAGATTAAADSNQNTTGSQVTVTAPEAGYVEKAGAWYYVNADQSYAKGLTTIAGHLQYFDATGRQTKGAYATENGKTYYFDANTDNALTGLQHVAGQTVAFNAQGEQIFSDFYTATDGQTYYFGANGQAVTGLTSIDGHNYYFDAAGQLKKGYAGDIDGQMRTFDATTGQEVSATTSQITEV